MATINGTTGKDVIVGTAGDDIIDGLAGNDSINGGAGNDVIYGNTGDDNLTGDAGNDTLYGGDGNDGFFGGGGNDTIYGENGNDNMFGDAGDDNLYGGSGNDTLTGGTGVNILDGGADNDTFVVKPGAGTNIILGGTGTDTVRIDFVSGDFTPGPRADAIRAELAAFDGWLQNNLAHAGATPALAAAALAAQSVGPAYSSTIFGFTASTVETLTVTLNGVAVPLASLLNTAPVTAAAVALATPEDTAVTGQVVATDAQGDTLTYAVTQGPAHGALTLSATTCLLYTSDAADE